MGIKIWMVVMASWGTPLTIKQMPGMSSCKAVARAVVEMSNVLDNGALRGCVSGLAMNEARSAA